MGGLDIDEFFGRCIDPSRRFFAAGEHQGVNAAFVDDADLKIATDRRNRYRQPFPREAMDFAHASLFCNTESNALTHIKS